MMPVMDGFQLVEEMKEFKDIPVIMLEQQILKSSDKLRGFFLSPGIDDYVTKPFCIPDAGIFIAQESKPF